MLKKIMVVLLTGLLLCQSAVYAAAFEVKKMDGVRDQMLQAQYWIDQLIEPQEIMMSKDEIYLFNKEIEKTAGTNMYHLTAFPSTYSKSKLLASIDQKIPEGDWFIDGKPVLEEYWQALKANLNIQGIAEENPVKYGFTVRRSNLKVFPTADIISDDPADLCYDEFQNSGILINEPVLVIHQSADAKWLYIWMRNCSGWILADDIAFSSDKASWLQQQMHTDFLVVTGNKIKLEANPYNPELSELELSMGSVLDFANDSELPSSIDGRALYDNYVVKIPTRGSHAELIYKLALLPVSRDVNCGYLPYTRANILSQVFKMEGDRYGWGGMLNARDCSQLVLEVYRCFGIYLPRNTEAQVKIPCKTASFGELNNVSRNRLLDQVEPGSLLYFPGHVMIYLGKSQGKHYVISDLGSFAQFEAGSDKANVIRTRSVVVNDLNIKRGSGKQWITCLTAAKQVEKARFSDLDGCAQKTVIESLAEQFIISGNDQQLFRPTASLSRAEFSAMLCKALLLDEDQEYAERFSDSHDRWFTGYIGAVAKAGIMSGTGQDKFQPDKTVQKEEIKTIIAQALKKKGITPESDQGKQIVNNITVVEGFNNQEKLVNRYQAALILYNYLQIPAVNTGNETPGNPR